MDILRSTTSTVSPTETASARPGLRLRSVLIGIACDTAPGLIAFFAARHLGATPMAALLAMSAAAVVRTSWVSLRQHRIDGVSLLICAALIAGSALSLLTGDPRVMMLKDSLVSAVSATIFAVSAPSRSPLAFQFLLRSSADGTPDLRQQWAQDPEFRRRMRVITAVWGSGLFIDAIARVPFVMWLDIDWATIASTVLKMTTFAGLLVWTVVYDKRAHRPGIARIDAAG